MDAMGSAADSASIAESYKRRVEEALLGNQRRVNKLKEPKTTGPSRFTTQYAIDWGKAKGWKVCGRERYDYRTRRHFDLMLGADAMFDAGDRIVLVQGAGKGERAEHRRRFDQAGGEAKARRLGMGFAYLEFDRGEKAPVKEEWWA